jgi:hypothetical protein
VCPWSHLDTKPFTEPVRLLPSLLAGNSVAFLQSSGKYVAPAPGDRKVIVRQDTPQFSQRSRNLFPLALCLIPTHRFVPFRTPTVPAQA